jgi:CheY-like chemotaxis protein
MSTILVIDDNSIERESVLRALQKAGYTVLGAEDGPTGIELAKEHPPDLIICDIEMPGLTGFETLKKLKEDRQTRSIPFVFLTGSVDAMAGKLGRELGAEEYVQKPFSFSKLLAVVSSSLHDKK